MSRTDSSRVKGTGLRTLSYSSRFILIVETVIAE